MKNILKSLLLVFITIHTYAQPNDELKALVKQSFSYFPKVQELEKTAEIGAVRVDLAKGGYLPSVTGNASYNYVDPVGETSIPIGDEIRKLQFQPHNNYNATIALNQVIWDFGKTQAQIQKAKADLQASQYNTDAAHLQLAAQVAGIYYGLIYLKRSIVVQDSVILFYEQNKKIVEGKMRQGDALQIDLSNIENSIEQERSRKVEFQRLYQRQLALLNYTTGARTEPTTLGFDFSLALAAASLEQNNPEVLAASQRVLAAEADAKLAQRNVLPSLNLVANAGFRNGYQPDIEEIRFNYLAGVTLSVPIFQGRRLRQNVMLSHRSVELNQLSKSNLSASLVKDLESVQADEQAYQQQMQHAEAQIKSATEALRLNRVRYERGVSTYLDLVYASTNLQRAVLNKLQYEYQRCLAQVEQARLLGVRFWE